LVSKQPTDQLVICCSGKSVQNRAAANRVDPFWLIRRWWKLVGGKLAQVDEWTEMRREWKDGERRTHLQSKSKIYINLQNKKSNMLHFTY
jgi:hypothetical protein